MKTPLTPRPASPITRRWLTLGCVLAASSAALDAAIVQRWSFNAPAGDVPSGTEVANEVAGGSAAVIRGAGAQMTNVAVKLPGGPSGSASYIDLPNGIVSGLTECTIEGWMSVDAGGWNWARSFDFGDSLGAEVPDVGGGGEGRDYLTLSVSRGTDYNVQRLEWRNETPGGPGPGGTTTLDSAVLTTFGQSFHYAVTVRPDGAGGSVINYYRNGTLISAEGATAFVLADINDVNNWLGRSNWTGDQNTAGSFDEFRIYDTALDETALLDSRTAGPDAGLPDGDGDGMPNFWELYYPAILNPADPADAALDGDTDGLSNLGEFQRKTNPTVVDSDGDGLSDGAEVNTHSTNPTLVDTDGDTLSDGAEVNTHGTIPSNPDTDGDTFSDGVEIAQGTDPKNASSVPLLLMVNRYGFDETAGSDARVVTDSVGGAHGAILGDGFSWSGSNLVLTGGSSDTAAYVDLPNGFISRHARAHGGSGTITLEGWVTVTDATPGWARLFDFGSSWPTTIEITGPGNTNGGSTEGRDYFMFTAYNGNDSATRQLDWRNEDPFGGGAVVGAYATDTFATQFHFVITVDEISRRARAFENGVQKTDMALTWGLADLHDNNCWLGRSNWTGDGNLAGTFNEFRLYSGIMTPTEIAANAAAGPGVVPVFDTDSDGMPDYFELRYGLNRNNAADATSDTDGDTLTALQEFQRSSRPNAVDSDGDGLPDLVETNTGTFVSPSNTGSHPSQADTDSDGATDAAEVTAGSNLRLFDTDSDGVSDGIEIAQGSNPTSLDPAYGPLAHRWAFNETAGAADDGALSTDLVGDDDAVIRGSGASFTGTAIDLPGGPSASAPYVDLVNGILSSRRTVSLEAWYSVTNTTNAWGRVFDFGDSAAQEQMGPGGGGEGTDYLALTASNGTNYDSQRLEWRDNNPGGGFTLTVDSNLPTPIGDGTLVHAVVTIDNSILGSTVINYWRDGELTTANAAYPGNLSQIHDVNNWLGRSNWSGDGNIAGTFDEFRVYDGVLNDAAVKANTTAGPDVVPGSAPPSNFVITSVTRNPATGEITLVWASEPGKTYVVQQSATLGTGSWTDIPGSVASAGTSTSVAITPPVGQLVNHYRIKLP